MIQEYKSSQKCYYHSSCTIGCTPNFLLKYLKRYNACPNCNQAAVLSDFTFGKQMKEPSPWYERAFEWIGDNLFLPDFPS